MIADSPTLTARLRDLHDQREERPRRTLLAAATGAPPRRHHRPGPPPALLGAVHRILFRRIQELTLAGHTNDEIAETITAEAASAFGMLEAALADYAVA